jgi:hypothetical protein
MKGWMKMCIADTAMPAGIAPARAPGAGGRSPVQPNDSSAVGP